VKWHPSQIMLGVLIGLSVAGLTYVLSKPAVEKAVEKQRDREIDLSLAKAAMDNASILATVSQLLRSNITVRAQDLLQEQLWWQ
jgi:hypothetical protein